MLNPFVGEILLFPFNFPPRGFAFCQGQLLPIAQNTALFSLLGTIYGGNGTTHFALPNLQGRIPVGFGQGSGLTNHDQGETGGSETIALTTAQMPLHTHAISASSVMPTTACRNDAGNQQTAVNNVPAITFYKRHNYHISRTIPRYYKDELDAFFMTKRL